MEAFVFLFLFLAAAPSALLQWATGFRSLAAITLFAVAALSLFRSAIHELPLESGRELLEAFLDAGLVVVLLGAAMKFFIFWDGWRDQQR